ncbi:MAG: malonyl-ACP O-methyltransferase BioC [Bacteroidetes bacterium]|nr:malonyl-ACP O-methyltransferase BioC [Bacteroidota bacterium]
MIVAEKQHIVRHFSKHANSYKELATVQRGICNRMINLLLQHRISPAQILEIGCGTGFLTEDFLGNFKVQLYTANDIAADMEIEMQRIAEKTGQSIQFLPGDAETITFNDRFDTILSTSTVQWFHNVPVFFKKIPQILQAKGIFAFSTFGTQNFQEIMTCTGQSLHYYSVEELCNFLAGNFQILHCESYEETLFFDAPINVLRHIKRTGVNNLPAGHWTKSRLRNFSDTYRALYSTQQGVTLTYNPIIIIAQKK